MTLEEKIKMYQGKKQFIENLNEVFQMEPKCGSVEGVSFEVFTKDHGEDRIETREWVIVHFVGGGKCYKVVSGNSNTANFRAIGLLLDGGHYEETRFYELQKENGFVQLEL